MKNKERFKTEAILIFVTLIWGGTFPVIKAGLGDISPLLMVTIRFFLAFLFILALAFTASKEKIYDNTSLSIGNHTEIGDCVDFSVDVLIGDSCVVGAGTFFNTDCTIGDNTSIVPGTIFKSNSVVPANSVVIHEGEDCCLAKVENKLSLT